MAKRAAAHQLTDINWEDEEEAENPGTFKPADQEVIQRREIKTAKRRVVRDQNTGSPASGGGAFKGFAGFGNRSAVTLSSSGSKSQIDVTDSNKDNSLSKAAPPLFTFGGVTNKPLGSSDKPLGGLSEVGMVKPTIPAFSFKTADEVPKFTFASKPDVADVKISQEEYVSESTESNHKADENADSVNGSKPGNVHSKDYFAQLKNLNRCLLNWIKQHVEKDPCVILTPVFTDYEKHLDSIKKMDVTEIGSPKLVESVPKQQSPLVQSSGDCEKDKEKKPSGSVFGGTGGGLSLNVADKLAPAASFTFSKDVSSSSVFGATSAGTALSTFPSVTSTSSVFGSATGTSLFSTTSTTSSSVFGSAGITSSIFGAAPATTGGFSFAASVAKSTTETASQEEEEYVPPKADVAEVKEEDALYTKRCKLFYNIAGSFKERGMGNLHLKPCGERTQMVIRADTSLGNILLNIMLHPSIPTKREGKNNVSLFTVPNPPVDPKNDDKKPVPMLIRVKSGEDADELLAHLDKYKN